MTGPNQGRRTRLVDLAALCWALAIALAFAWTQLDVYRRALRALGE